MVLFVLLVAACGSKTDQPSSGRWQALCTLIEDEKADLEERLDAMRSLKAPVPQQVVESLLLVMKDKSQQAFIMVPDDSSLFYHVEESPYGGPDERAEIRWTAVETLQRLREKQALPDLISALYDRQEVVRHFAARALWYLGSREGLPVLLKGLEGKALANESANRILKEISGRDFGFNTDQGWVLKKAAIDRWREHAAGMKPRAPHPRFGEDPDLDRRVRFLVAVLGQHQFLFMEQARRNLGQMGELAVEHIRRAWDDPALGAGNQQLRAYAVQSLAMIGSSAAAALIVEKGAGDDSPAVRSRAAGAMASLDDAASAEALLSLLNDPDEGVVVAATLSLGRREVHGGEDRLLKQFARAPNGSRLKLLTAWSLVRLGRRGSPWGSYLEEVMRQGPVHVRVELADLLREWRGDLFGWDESADPGSQEAALARWHSILVP